MRPITKGAGKRYDDLRKVREAKFGRQNETKLETKTETKNPQEGGRPLLGSKPMTVAERVRRHRARKGK
jgi:hypothetical protein